jgi:AraC family transcriptional regulator
MRTDTRSDYETRIGAAVEFVLNRLDSPPSPTEIADHAGFSRFHFGRVFSLAIGEPLAEFGRRLRLERAAWNLKNSGESITEIALCAGYESLEGFSRAFREWFHVSPTEYRASTAHHEIQSACEVHWCPTGSRSTPVLVLNQELKMIATIEKLDTITVVGLRHIGPYHLIGPKFSELMGWVNRHHVPVGMGLAIYYDNPDEVAGQDLRSDACITVPADFVLPSTDGLDIRIEQIQGGEYASVTHIGPYEGLGDAWARFCGQAVPKLGREFAQKPPFEIYRNNYMTTPPQDLRTDLYVALQPL